ncbi:hypothetical protein Nepgr_017082 [Nepenthes gracilis]|uniref:Uncharacterized protein n=1 Tax=Nepenthes gracilis TaxID=150966 RepID=A0AAD3XSZ1_NEPGR|nr:hypothetical protein Nepgr_017082 [Nepenthes gracilis]
MVRCSTRWPIMLSSRMIVRSWDDSLTGFDESFLEVKPVEFRSGSRMPANTVAKEPMGHANLGEAGSAPVIPPVVASPLDATVVEVHPTEVPADICPVEIRGPPHVDEPVTTGKPVLESTALAFLGALQSPYRIRALRHLIQL